MAVTQNTYTGDGTTVLFSFTFPYLETTDIKVSLDGSITTAYSLANATTIQFNTAPANGVAIRIYRVTDDAALSAQFYPGSAIRSQDLNDNFTQNLYVTQESNRDATQAITTADAATVTANSAVTTANSAVATANTASTNASAAVATANTASSNASAAVATANTASTNATTAINTANAATATANSAATDAATAISTANGAVTTANSAATDAATAISTANTASTNASSAVATANTASTNATTAVNTANNAVTTANSAVSTANSAVTTANSADSKADQAIAAVANALLFTIVANVAAIPGSPADGDAIEITDSTGIESFTPLSGLPTGFVGDSGLGVRLVYDGTGTTWVWLQYFPQDPDDRYAGVNTSAGTAAAPSIAFGPTDTNTGIYSPGADQLALSTNGTGRLFVDADGRVLTGVSSTSNTCSAVFQGRSDGNLNAVLRLHPNTTAPTSAAGLGNITFGTPSSAFNGSASIIGFRDGGTWVNDTSMPGALTFNTTPDGSAAPQERLRITSAGLVGIGTSSPAAELHVENAGSSTIIINNSSNSSGLSLEGTSTTGVANIRSRYNDSQLTFSTAGASGTGGAKERMRIDSQGRVGIGTLSPSAALSIVASGNINGVEINPENSTDTNRILCLDRSTLSRTKLELDSSELFHTNNATETFRIDSSGRLGIGTSSPSTNLHVQGAVTNGDVAASVVNYIAGGSANGSTTATLQLVPSAFVASQSSALIRAYRDGTWSSNTTRRTGLSFSVTENTDNGPQARVVIDPYGKVGIGTTSPDTLLNLVGGVARISGTRTAGSFVDIGGDNTGSNGAYISVSYYGSGSYGPLRFTTGGSEKARIDSSGRLLVGTSSARTDFKRALNIESIASEAGITITRGDFNASPPIIQFGKQRGAVGANGLVAANDGLGMIEFSGGDGTDLSSVGARIAAYVDGTPGANDMPGYLSFSTTADGASSPTERMRISKSGNISGGNGFPGTASSTDTGFGFDQGGFFRIFRSAGQVVEIGRQTNDGELVAFYQAGTKEGSISVSGTTVSYNGAHLSRWSQLSGIDPYDKTVRPEILRGTVMSNLDEMCDWICPESGDCQDNEQLNKTKVSDIEGDKNVAGVFQSWDDDDDTWVNDFYLAMTGDFIIRIAQGVTVERGDLLMSAGDGTAKPQDDDIIRSKTIAKVTSTTVSCTHPDGSYCVPCVLMAC